LALTGRLEAGVPRDPLKEAQAAVRSVTERRAEARRAVLHPDPDANKPVLLPFSLELKRPRSSRLEVRFRDEAAVQVYDGTRGWKLRPFLGRREVEPYTDEELQQASQQAALEGPLMDHAARGDVVELAGREQVEGHDVFNLKVTSRAGATRTVLVDAQTYLEWRVDGMRKLDGKAHRVWTTFTDYKAVDGVLVPHTLTTSVEGVAGAQHIFIDRVTLNPEVSDARFSKPQ
jgi:hypothetical protein